MSIAPAPRDDFRFTRDAPPAIWLAIAALLIAGAMVLQALFPRYEFRVIGDDGRAMMIYDRWTNRFQRAVYDEKGEPTLTGVISPF
jgi:hypothetical protein